MRVVSGKYKGKRFFPPKRFPSRPTTDMAKEALFGIIDSKVYFEKLDVLDLFSGTGNISVEFLSRGVGKVVGVDQNMKAIRFQRKLCDELDEKNWQIIKHDAFNYIELSAQKFDIIFADPPYGLPGSEKLPELIFEHGLLVEDGLLVIEHGNEVSFKGSPNFKRTRNYGGVQFSFFEL